LPTSLIIYFCQFFFGGGADVSLHHAFLHPLGQLLEHFVSFCPVLYKSLFTENTVASKEKKAQQRKHKYNSNKVHDSR